MTKLDPDASGAFSIGGCLTRAREWEPQIDAWADIDFSGRSQPGAACEGPLAGIAFAVKDVIDVAGWPTRFGCDAFAAAPVAETDASVVAALRAAGAAPIGKSRTTAFAFIDPTSTRNPYDLQRTPGGSSSGSGAVVGARVVPFALGTQTAGSLCRPAVYCGAVSYKPTIDALPVFGVAPLSRSFDSVGVIATSFDWIERTHAVLAQTYPAIARPERRTLEPLRIGVGVNVEQAPDRDVAAALSDAAERFAAAGHAVSPFQCPVSFAEIVSLHRTVMLHEAARDLIPLIGARRAMLPPKLAAGLAEGEGVSEQARIDALGQIRALRRLFWGAAEGFDVILSPPASGVAPIGLSTTGDQSYLTPWTALGGPLVSLAAGLNAQGAPLGVLLAARPGRDGALVDAGAALAPLLPETPAPHLR